VNREGEPSWLDELNPEQRGAVTHGDGPLLVVAGAGSGKTKTLAYRVASLLARGVDPDRILLLTFTRRAAQEMLRRASAVAARGSTVSGRVWGGTFHSTANRLLRIYAASAGLDRDFTVMDPGDAQDLLGKIRHEMGLHGRDKRFPRKQTCLAIYSRRVNGSEDLGLVLKQQFPWCEVWQQDLRALFKEYVDRKLRLHVLDFDDLLLYWEALVQDRRVASELCGRFDHILVDEYQDTNCIQAAILRGMRCENENITVVGDDAQSIYSFRAATVRNMLDFPEQFPETTIVTLERNYRSVAPILETTNRVIAGAKERFSKDLHSVRGEGERPKLVMCSDEQQQDEYVIDRVLTHYEQGIPLRKQAVLFRASHLANSLELELTRRNIPYHKYGGLRFLEASHVKDLIAVLRILENPRDEMAWLRTLQLIDGVGPATAERAIAHVAENAYDPRSIGGFDAPKAARASMAELARAVEEIVAVEGLAPAVQVDRVRAFYDPLLERLYENPRVRARDLDSLSQIADAYRSRGRFLVDLQLDPPTSTSDLAGPPVKDEDWLVLSTIHSAKGCEWDVVFLIHAADGFLPSDMACGSDEELEEELRVTYVALTRARDFLYVTWPLRYYATWTPFTDRHTYAQLCRFFTNDVRKSLDEVPLAQLDGGDPGETILPEDDVTERIRAMWD